MAPPRVPIDFRLKAKSKRVGECLIWTGNTTKDGYGVMTVGRNKQYRVHRLAYIESFGPIPDGIFVCHKCDNPLCIEPSHLFLGTPKENTHDMIAKGRKKILVGDEHPNTKISINKRCEIIKRRASGETLKSIALDYGVCFQTISVICRGHKNYGTANR